MSSASLSKDCSQDGHHSLQDFCVCTLFKNVSGLSCYKSHKNRLLSEFVHVPEEVELSALFAWSVGIHHAEPIQFSIPEGNGKAQSHFVEQPKSESFDSTCLPFR
jgi:hypothetical protein